MNRKYIVIAGYLGALSVVIGAFGTHGIKDKISPDDYTIFETGVRYQFYHVLALLATGILYATNPVKMLAVAARLFIAGIILFSGSLYVLTYFAYIKAGSIDGLNWVGAIAPPVGGLSFIVGWVCLAIGARKQKAV